MNKIGFPSQLAHGLHATAVEEHHAFVVVGMEHAVLVAQGQTFGEILVVVNKIHLSLGIRHGTDLNNQIMVDGIDYQIHTRKTDNLVQLVFDFVHIVVTGHKSTDFLTFTGYIVFV